MAALPGGPGEAGEVVAAALRELPASADLLYLEFCGETCERVSAPAAVDGTGAAAAFSQPHPLRGQCRRVVIPFLEGRICSATTEKKFYLGLYNKESYVHGEKSGTVFTWSLP